MAHGDGEFTDIIYRIPFDFRDCSVKVPFGFPQVGQNYVAIHR